MYFPYVFWFSSLGSSAESVIGKLFGCEVENSSLCRCGKETVRSSLTLLFTMHYPEHSSPGRIQASVPVIWLKHEVYIDLQNEIVFQTL